MLGRVEVAIRESESGGESLSRGGDSLSFFGGGRVPTFFSSSERDIETSREGSVVLGGFLCFGV